MGLFRKSKSAPPPKPADGPDQPIWLFRIPSPQVDGAWVYQVFRGDRRLVAKCDLVPWDALPGVQQTVGDYLNRKSTSLEMIGITLQGEWLRWELPCPPPPVPGTVRLLDAAQMAEYQHLLESELTGEEQRQLSPEERKAYLDVQLRDVPMASSQKPDINGLREGDRVRLVKGFNGERSSFEAGSTGTIFIPSTAPAEIRMFREDGFYHVIIDEVGQCIGIRRHEFERISGRADVSISDGVVSISNVQAW